MTMYTLDELRWWIQAAAEDNKRQQAALSYWCGKPAKVPPQLTAQWDGAMQLQLVRCA